MFPLEINNSILLIYVTILDSEKQNNVKIRFHKRGRIIDGNCIF